jgi:hypothetical protein
VFTRSTRDPTGRSIARARSALRTAIDARGDDALRWLGFQIAAARGFLAKNPSRGRTA